MTQVERAWHHWFDALCVQHGLAGASEARTLDASVQFDLVELSLGLRTTICKREIICDQPLRQRFGQALKSLVPKPWKRLKVCKREGALSLCSTGVVCHVSFSLLQEMR